MPTAPCHSPKVEPVVSMRRTSVPCAERKAELVGLFSVSFKPHVAFV